jgi:hypothetical protein
MYGFADPGIVTDRSTYARGASSPISTRNDVRMRSDWETGVVLISLLLRAAMGMKMNSGLGRYPRICEIYYDINSRS